VPVFGFQDSASIRTLPLTEGLACIHPIRTRMPNRLLGLRLRLLFQRLIARSPLTAH
jgi:hypothetical protein